MPDADPVRCWLVERGIDSRDLLTLVYATPDGERALRRELSAANVGGVTAARDVDPGALEPVADEETRERYAREARRMADDHDPDDEI